VESGKYENIKGVPLNAPRQREGDGTLKNSFGMSVTAKSSAQHWENI